MIRSVDLTCGKNFNLVILKESVLKYLICTRVLNIVVKHKECQSDFFPCLTGVRPGENLFPFLFSIFLNDLEDYFKTRWRSFRKAKRTVL